MKKRGQIWISAVIYIGLGVVAITLLVAAGVPIINKMRDRNTFIQTKELMHSIDDAIFTVVSEGPGSQRYLSPVTIRKGKLYIKENLENNIIWRMETNAILQEPGSTLTEGNLRLIFNPDPNIVDEFEAEIEISQEYLESREIFLTYNGDPLGNNVSQPLDGKFSMTIVNNGVPLDAEGIPQEGLGDNVWVDITVS